MKIVQINAVATSSSTGRTTIELHKALKKLGYQSWIAAPDAPDSPDFIRIGSRTDRRVHALYSRVFGKQGYASKRSTNKLLDKLALIKPDIVHLRNLHGNYINLPLLLKYLGENDVKVVVTLHDFWFITGHCCYFVDSDCAKWKSGCGACPEIRKWNPSWFFDKSGSNLGNKRRLFEGIKNLAVIGVSRWVTDFVKDSILKNARIVTTIYNWIDTSVFYPRDVRLLRKKYEHGFEKIIVGVSHVWDKQKGLYDFISVANHLPTYRFILIGSLKADIHLPPNILTLGRTNNVNELAEFYSMGDVFFNPSRRETFGKVTAEALSCGSPVVAYDATATSELVSHECGSLIKVGDIDAAVSEIRRIASIGNLRRSCREYAVSTFDRNHLTQEMIDVYNKL